MEHDASSSLFENNGFRRRGYRFVDILAVKIVMSFFRQRFSFLYFFMDVGCSSHELESFAMELGIVTLIDFKAEGMGSSLRWMIQIEQDI